MIEPISARLRNKIISALAELRFGEIGKAKKHLKAALMIMDANLETTYYNGIPVCPGDGEYKVLIDDIHVLTKRIKDGQGTNHFPCLTYVPLLPWRGIMKRYGLMTGDFEVIPDDKDRTIKLVYKDGHVVDKIRQVRGEKNTWIGAYYYDNELKFWFKLVKIG